MNDNHPPVLVVGAGPVGLVAALMLVQNGIPVRIIDKDPNHHIGQRGPGIWPRTLEVFNFLDVPEVNDLGKPSPLIRRYKIGSMEILKAHLIYPHREPTPAIPFYVPKLMGQELLEVILRRHLEKFSCFVESSTELRSFTQSNEQITGVLVKKQGDNEILETFSTKWMIGADGAKGMVRKRLGLTFLGETRDDFRVVTGDVRLTGPGLDRMYWHRFGNFNGRAISLRPTDEVGEDGWQFFIVEPDCDVERIAQSQQLVYESITSMVDTEITFNKLVWSTHYQPNIRMVNKFSEGRVFVAGDAAHVSSPTGGQGLNSGVQDAFNLGWKLALVEKGLADKSLLETYTTERLPVISEMLEVTTSIMNHAMETGSLSGWSNIILWMLGINYRFSSIVLDEFATPVKGKPMSAYGALNEGYLEAGDRAPDAPKLLCVHPENSDTMTLFGLYRPWYHTVLVFAPNPADATQILTALERCDKSVVQSAVILPSSALATPITHSANLVLLDQEGHAYSAYLVKTTKIKVFVIRPDGVIGAIVHDADGVKKYFSKIFREIYD
ncbi:hypothetical protein AZE42_08330 [Rhizopogon vesiculosus]|uniref:FAD-binding domain-containing protein n=1 Tax=Rhizopogon vesiculosus TaxID=180088 RepID=A0A1J8R3U1_9AGAM|nr:hypothetical protein AZE42_08330 [Rhizopogon vesiculosus]